MKVKILIAVFALFTSATFAQENAIDKYFSNYNNENTTQIHVTGKMFELLAEIDLEDDDLGEMLSGINDFTAIIDQENIAAKSSYQQANSKVGSEFEELISVNDKEGNATFYIKEANGVVEEMLMIGHGPKEFILVSITGNVDLKAVSKIMKEVNMDGYMHKTSMKNLEEFKIYPNPATDNGKVTVEIPEGLLNGQYQILDMQGKTVESGDLNERSNQVNTNGLAKGKYLIKVFKGDFDISKKLILN